MADLRIPATGPQTPATRLTPVRSEAVRAAQRAFFDAALNGAANTAAPAAPQRATAASTASPLRNDAQPSRNLRPGSILDIKV